MKQPLIVLTGPTASGKTALSIGLAKAIGGEIISADSMQVYRQMDIGTAKIRPEEMEGIPHYLVDVLEPDASFNVVIFQQMAREAMARIRAVSYTHLGAEIGISTQKLHARGPMGLKELTTTKYVIYGDGQIRE